jgi:hypothetical protein
LNTSEKLDLEGWQPVAMMFTGSIVFILLAGDILHRTAEILLSVNIN